MLTDDQSRRDCRPWERPWRTFCVDKNVKDEWLERLNSLTHFDLISICEGHPKGSPEIPHRSTHFNLRLKEELVTDLINDWSTIGDTFGEGLENAFNDTNTTAHFEVRSGYIKDKKELAAQNIVLLKIARHPDLLSTQPSDPITTWFEANVTAAEAFDNFCTTQLTR